MAKVAYQDCVVLKLLRWKDDSFIISLLGPKWCVFNALWTLPKSKRSQRKAHPELFQNIQATLQHYPEGLHRLRDFKELPSPEVNSLDQYLSLNYLARHFLINCSEAPDKAPWHIWQRFQSSSLSFHHARLNLMAELCYHNGTWPAGDFCEACNAPLKNHAYLDFTSLLCQNCHEGGTHLDASSLSWIQHRFYIQNLPSLNTEQSNMLTSWLKRRLPENVAKDRVMRKIWNMIS